MAVRNKRKSTAARLARARRGLPGSPANDPARVGVRELRQNLSVYLDRVKAGETLTVTEHGSVVAVLAPPRPGSTLESMVAEGRATAPRVLLGQLPPPRPAPLPGPPAEVLIGKMREERLP
jgi:prevent-host-death family protein